jgi:1-acyl-sn-glycerol-3-phosphate acyltransferase
MRAQGLENLPERGSYIIVPSHVSMLDWAFLSYFLTRLTSFVVHREYYDHWLLGVGLRVNGAVPVRSEGADLTAMRSMRALLASGEPLILFPEGGISRDGRPQRAQPGIISLASSTRTPIVPVAFRGAFEAFPRWQRLPRPGRVTVVFGAPLEPPPQLSGRDAQQELADCLMDHIGGLLDGRTSNPIPW